MKLLSQMLAVLVASLAATGFSVDAVSAPELDERTVDLGNDVSLRVIEAGDPISGASLVFIPGWSTTADIWREQINRFAPSYRMISFDPRSQGREGANDAATLQSYNKGLLYNRLFSVTQIKPSKQL